jgi:hypothetical protein
MQHISSIARQLPITDESDFQLTKHQRSIFRNAAQRM